MRRHLLGLLTAILIVPIVAGQATGPLYAAIPSSGFTDTPVASASSPTAIEWLPGDRIVVLAHGRGLAPSADLPADPFLPHEPGHALLADGFAVLLQVFPQIGAAVAMPACGMEQRFGAETPAKFLLGLLKQGVRKGRK